MAKMGKMVVKKWDFRC